MGGDLVGLKVGDRVIIVSMKSKYYGCQATVERKPYRQTRYGSTYIGVIPDGAEKIYYSSRYHNRYLSLLLTSVEKIEEKRKWENNMAKLTGYRAVAVVKQGYNDYHFAIYDDRRYKAGDRILVSGCNIGVLTIDEVITPEEAKARYPKDITSEVITYVDMFTYEKRLEKRKAAEELKKKMDAEMKKMDETAKYEMYAKQNPDLAKMLDEYRELTGC